MARPALLLRLELSWDFGQNSVSLLWGARHNSQTNVGRMYINYEVW